MNCKEKCKDNVCIKWSIRKVGLKQSVFDENIYCLNE